jgi:hypothetical protein
MFIVTLTFSEHSEWSSDREEVRQHYIDMMKSGELTVDDFEIDIMDDI